MTTNLALYLSIDLSGLKFLLKIHLLLIGLLPEGKFANSQVWLLRMDSISLFIFSLYICASGVDIAFLNIWGSLLSAYDMKSGQKDFEIFDLWLHLGSSSRINYRFIGSSFLNVVSCVLFPEVFSSLYLYEKMSSKNTTSLDSIIISIWISGTSDLCTRNL